VRPHALLLAACLAAGGAAAGEADDMAAAARALSDPDAKVRERAASELWAREKAASPAKAALVKALDDPSPSVAIRAAGALSFLGMTEADLAPTRERVMKAPEARSDDRFMAARGLVGRLPATTLAGPMLDYLHEYPAGNNATSAQRALDRLAKAGDRAIIAPIVESLRRARKPNEKYVLLATLKVFEPRAQDVAAWMPVASPLLRDPDESVRQETLWLMSRAGPLAASQGDAIAAMLDDSDSGVRRRAALTLGEIGDARGLPAIRKLDPGKDAEAFIGERDAARRLSAPKIDPGSAFQALMMLDSGAVKGLLDAGLEPSGDLAGNGAPLYVVLQWAPLSCSPAVRPTQPATKAMLKMLLERGADANAGDRNGNTPLMAAASHGCDREVMHALIASGAKLDAVGKTGLTAFEQGLVSGHDGLEELIAAGYRVAPEKAKALEKTYAARPASLALVRKAARK
jgi:HEAT repeat protein